MYQELQYNVSDAQAPTVPTDLAASNITETTASLSWFASTDNVGVTEYEVFSSGTSVETVTSTGTNITGLTANTTYSYTVTAKDLAGNISAQSNMLVLLLLEEEAQQPQYTKVSLNLVGMDCLMVE